MNAYKQSILSLFFLLAHFALQAQTFTATVEQPVPDDGTSIAFTIEVSGLPEVIDTSFGLVQVCLNIDHPWDADLDVRLIAPDGTAFLLFAGVGGDGDNFVDCCLRDDAADFIYNHGAPFTGSFKPMGNMGNVNNGQNPNGTWTILLLDTYAFADAGYMKDWSLTFDADAPGPFVFPGTNLPIVKIETGGQTIPNEPKILAALKVIDKGGGQTNHANDTTFAFEGNILVELQGYTGPGYPKKNFDFDLVDASGLEYDTTLLGLPAENDWNLKAEYLDPTLMANAVAYEFARRMGRYAPRTMYCEVFVDGDYVGVYNLTEKVKRDKDRVDIAKLSPQDTLGDELTGGYIIEMNINGAPGDWNSAYPPINVASNGLPVEFKFVTPFRWAIHPLQADYIRSYVDSFELSLHEPNFADPELGYRRWIDDSTFMDFMFVNEFSTNYDSYGRSTFLYKEKITDGGKLKIGPAWDYDRGYCCVEGWVWELTHPVWPFPDWWSIMHSDSLFLQQRHCRWQELRQDPWTTDAFLNMVDSLHALLGPAAARNFQRWPELGFADFDGNVLARKDNIAARLAWMDGQISGESCEVLPPSSTDEPETAPFTVFPNPAHEVLRVGVPEGHAPFALRIFDAHGKVFFERALGSEGLRVDVSNWPSGIYFVEGVNEDGKWVEKIAVY